MLTVLFQMLFSIQRHNFPWSCIISNRRGQIAFFLVSFSAYQMGYLAGWGINNLQNKLPSYYLHPTLMFTVLSAVFHEHHFTLQQLQKATVLGGSLLECLELA